MPPTVALFLDPPSEHFLGDRLFERDTHGMVGNDMAAPYRALREHFAKREIPVHTADLMASGKRRDVNVYVSFGINWRYEKLAREPDTVLSAYFAMECPIVEPGLYRMLPDISNRFRRVFTWTEPAALEPFTGTRIRSQRFHWPQERDDVVGDLWRRTDRSYLVLINSNKLPRLYDRELYTERLRAIEFFHRNDEIAVYGKHWDGAPRRVGATWIPATGRRLGMKLWEVKQRCFPDPLYQAAAAAHCGPTASKLETLSGYQFALCFENMILEGWITEKIFDCFFAGTVPVYLGAPDISRFVPKECFVDMRDFKGYRELSAYLRSLSSGDVLRFREAAREYLRSARFDPFRIRTFVERIDHIVSLDTNDLALQGQAGSHVDP